MLAVEEEVIDLQKDFVVYLLFTYCQTEELKKINFYCEEFKEIVKRSGGLSEKGGSYIDRFCNNIRLLLTNATEFDSETASLELVRAISADEFTKAILMADKRYTSTDHSKAEGLLDKITSDCMKKSKKSSVSVQSQTSRLN